MHFLKLRSNHSRCQQSDHSDLSCNDHSCVVICSFVEKVILELQITLPVYAATVLITQRTVMEKAENVTVVCTTPQVRLIIVSSALNL